MVLFTWSGLYNIVGNSTAFHGQDLQCCPDAAIFLSFSHNTCRTNWLQTPWTFITLF